MRKPLVVVCGVTAAVLIGGGIYATTAGADEAPGVPAVTGLDFPGMPAIPQVAGDSDGAEQPHVTFPDLDDQGDDQNADDQKPDDPSVDDQDADHQTDGLGAGDQPAGDQDGTSQRPGGHAAAAQRPAQQPAQRPANERPAQAVHQKPANVMAAAQRDVSPASVSMSPTAPVQQQMLTLVNENRRRGGCGSLSLDRRLIVAAYGHAADMARRNYFAHESPNGDGSSDRMSEAGYRWSRYGENIARGQDSVYEVVNGWMHSPVHRENIMDCKLEQMGIGLAFAPDRTPYWVQDFGTPQ